MVFGCEYHIPVLKKHRVSICSNSGALAPILRQNRVTSSPSLLKTALLCFLYCYFCLISFLNLILSQLYYIIRQIRTQHIQHLIKYIRCENVIDSVILCFLFWLVSGRYCGLDHFLRMQHFGQVCVHFKSFEFA